MAIFVLSPHPDDAVLSCWRLLTAPGDVRVINVFTAAPDAAGPRRVAWWDQLTGAMDGGVRMRERLLEDQEALARAGRRARNLGFLDGQYRRGRQPADEIARRIAREVAADALLVAPAGLGAIPDHEIVRAAALALERRGHAVAFYADLPHAIRFGWPASVTGEDPVDGLDVDGYWTATLEQGIPDAGSLTRELHVLDDDALSAKAAAVASYRTQLPALVALNGRLSDPSALRYEATWRRARA
ncbi:MAG TPA: PIG-L family deacetylase [Baekduia sp.]|nr:PIG-L family deacetylase [Baekduia sp.]